MGLEDDFLKDDLDDEKTIEYIKNYLPQELKEKYSDDELYYFLDLIDEYYSESGILDAKPDEDGCIEVDLGQIVDYIIKEAHKDEMGEYDPEAACSGLHHLAGSCHCIQDRYSCTHLADKAFIYRFIYCHKVFFFMAVSGAHYLIYQVSLIGEKE